MIEDRIKLFFTHNKFSKEKLKLFEEKFNRSFSRIIGGLEEDNIE